MNADQLLEAAAIVATSTAQRSRILAEDMRQEAAAANGYGTAATLQLSIALDNDRGHAARVREIMAGVPLYLAETMEDARRAQTSHLADALRELCEELCGTEGVIADRHGLRSDANGGNASLTPIMLAMIRVALCDVDWIGLAKHYISEEG